MLIVCHSPKGGSGCTVTAATLALLLAPRHRGGGHVVDLAGDLSATLGVPESADHHPRDVNSALQLHTCSHRDRLGTVITDWDRVVSLVGSLSGPVVVPCYLALRRATTQKPAGSRAPDGVVVVNEPNRALGPKDVETVLRVPVRAVVPFDASISRAVDAGLLSHRIPKVAEEGLAELVGSLSGSADEGPVQGLGPMQSPRVA
jgi:MinD-like ATPase involved in chromosome partitioning or flagellar assembly